jgi:outer membrane protein assembly factor BamB
MHNHKIRRLIVPLLLGLGVLWASARTINLAGASGAAQAGPLNKFVYLPLVMRAEPPYDWLQFNGDARHSGSNALEKSISPANVNLLHVLFQTSLPAVADGAPVYLNGVTTVAGIRDVIFVTTRTGDLVALDATTGATIWLQPSWAGSCLINNNAGRNEACYTTASPAIDPGRQHIYSYGLDGYVHKYAVGDGTEVVTGGWPELTSRKVYDEKGSSALTIATAQNGISYMYVAHGGYPGDAGNYQGHLTAINLSDGTQKVFNTLCSNQTVHFVDSRVTAGADCFPTTQSAIWARAGVIYDSDNDRLYMATGNGSFSPAQFLWADTVFALHPDGTGAGNGNPLDSYTPINFQELANADLDLGSTAPALLPAASRTFPHLAVQGGKDAVLRLINLDNLGGHNQVGLTGGEVFSIPVPMGGGILTQPAVWVNLADNRVWVFVSNSSGIAGLQLVVDGAGNPSLQPKWTAGPGTSPIVANGVLFYAQSGLISALNPTDGTVLWSDHQIGGIHWQSPIVANGVLYLADQNGKLTAYSLR